MGQLYSGRLSDCISVVTSTSVLGDGRISTHADPTRGQCARPRRMRHGCPACICALGSHGACDVGAIRPILGFWDLLGGAKSPNWDITCLERRWTAVQNLSPLALSSAEKSVSVQTNKQTKLQTVTDCGRFLWWQNALPNSISSSRLA